MKTVKGGFNYKKNLEDRKLMAVQVPERPVEISILDETNAFSAINLLPGEIAEKLKKIPEEYFRMSEDSFELNFKPDALVSKLKLRFWDEWQTNILSKMGGGIVLASIYYGVCTREYFYGEVLNNDINLAWMVRPPEDYVVTMREVLRQGIRKLEEIIKLNVVETNPVMVKSSKGRGASTDVLRDEDGKIVYEKKINPSVIREIRQIVTLLLDRVHGAIIQKIDINQRSLAMNLSAEANNLIESHDIIEVDNVGIEEMDDLKLLENQILKLDNILTSIGDKVDGSKEE